MSSTPSEQLQKLVSTVAPAGGVFRYIKHLGHFFVYFFAVIGFVLVSGYVAVLFHLTDTAGVIDTQNDFFKQRAAGAIGANATSSLIINPHWKDTDEWKTIKTALVKDVPMIQKVSTFTDVDARLITAQLVVEQLRLFTSEREVFKQIFAPLKILGSQTQFSWGIVGIKEETAIAAEEHLKDPASPFYLGKDYEHALDFTTDNPGVERFTRITDEHNHYYAYLYAALYIKQIEAQWKKAGFDISRRPEILSTLYNIGFSRSIPKASPDVGGAEIDINGVTYSFGSLAYNFYYSNEFADVFPVVK